MKLKSTTLLIAILLLISALNQTLQSENVWRFAVVGDTHVGSSDTIAEMIPYMIEDGIECILIPGDIAEGGLASNAVKLKAQLLQWQKHMQPLYDKGIGVYPIYGNHENDAKNNLTAWNDVFSGNYLLPQNGPEGEKNLSYSFTHKNALFIGLDDYKNIHKVDQEWLNQELSSNTLPHIFVFGHEAAFKVFHADCLDDSLNARNTFWESLVKAGVKTYFCGHDHFVDVSRIDDGDGNQYNDVYQYLVGTGGGWLMSQYSNYNGVNTPYAPKRIFHEMEFGYALVEISGETENDRNVTITWKKRTWNAATQSNEYLPTANVIQYSINKTTAIQEISLNVFSIYPNPASDFINISDCWGETKIYNSNGTEVWNKSLNGTEKLNTSAFVSGIYIVKNNNSIHKLSIIHP